MNLPDPAAIEAYIRQQAAVIGINPDIAVAVAKSEGLKPGVWQSNVVKNGVREPSYGPFQLYEGGGLGNEFKAKFGKSASDPTTWMDQVGFALGKAKEGGWTPWYGAKNTGIGRWDGIKASGQPQATAQPSGGPGAGLGSNQSPEAAYNTPQASYSPSQGPGEASTPTPWDFLSGNKDSLQTAAQGLGEGLGNASTPTGLDPREIRSKRMGDLGSIEPTSYTRRKQPSIFDLLAQGGY